MLTISSDIHESSRETHQVGQQLPGRFRAEHTNSTLRGSWTLLMPTVPLQGTWVMESTSPPPALDASGLDCFSRATSARRAVLFSPGGSGG